MSNAAGEVGTSAGPSAGYSSGGVDHRERGQRDDSGAHSLDRPASAAR